MPVFIVTDTEPIGVKCTPSVDQNEVNVLPRRCSFSHPGAAPGSAPALALVPPATARYCIATPFDGETMASTCGDSAVNGVLRNITPALVHALTFCSSR